MKDVKKTIKNGIIFLLLIAITFIIIFNNHNLELTLKTMLKVKLPYVLLGIFAMFIYFLLESLNVKNILQALGKKISIFKSLKYSLIGFFFSGITPAATGGQPMEIYYMSKEDIPVRYSTIALLLQLCSFQIVTITIGIVGAILNHKLLDGGFIWVFIVGLLLNSIALTAMLIGLFTRKLSKKIVKLFLTTLKKIKFKNIDKIQENIDTSLDEYHKSATFIKKNKRIIIESLIIVLIQSIIYYTVSFFVYKSFGLKGYNIVRIVLIQAMLFISVSSIPLPGSVGISENLFLKIYITIYGKGSLTSAMLISRGISFYLYILIGFIVTVLNAINVKKKNKES